MQGTNDVTLQRWHAESDPNEKIVEALLNITQEVHNHAPEANVLIAAPILTKEFNGDNPHKSEQDAFARLVHNMGEGNRRFIVKEMMMALNESDLRDACEIRTRTLHSRLTHHNNTLAYIHTGIIQMKRDISKWQMYGTMQ